MTERATILCVRDNRIRLVGIEGRDGRWPGGRIRRGEALHEAALGWMQRRGRQARLR